MNGGTRTPPPGTASRGAPGTRGCQGRAVTRVFSARRATVRVHAARHPATRVRGCRGSGGGAGAWVSCAWGGAMCAAGARGPLGHGGVDNRMLPPLRAAYARVAAGARVGFREHGDGSAAPRSLGGANAGLPLPYGTVDVPVPPARGASHAGDTRACRHGAGAAGVRATYGHPARCGGRVRFPAARGAGPAGAVRGRTPGSDARRGPRANRTETPAHQGVRGGRRTPAACFAADDASLRCGVPRGRVGRAEGEGAGYEFRRTCS